jgi:hypothetical protein
MPVQCARRTPKLLRHLGRRHVARGQHRLGRSDLGFARPPARHPGGLGRAPSQARADLYGCPMRSRGHLAAPVWSASRTYAHAFIEITDGNRLFGRHNGAMLPKDILRM